MIRSDTWNFSGCYRGWRLWWTVYGIPSSLHCYGGYSGASGSLKVLLMQSVRCSCFQAVSDYRTLHTPSFASIRSPGMAIRNRKSDSSQGWFQAKGSGPWPYPGHSTGSDVVSMKTTARAVDSGRILNGTKIWIPNVTTNFAWIYLSPHILNYF